MGFFFATNLVKKTKSFCDALGRNAAHSQHTNRSLGYVQCVPTGQTDAQSIELPYHHPTLPVPRLQFCFSKTPQ